MKSWLLILFLLVSINVQAQDKEKTIEEKEGELVDFKSIQEVLKEDQLTEEVHKKVSRIQTIKKERKKADLER